MKNKVIKYVIVFLILFVMVSWLKGKIESSEVDKAVTDYKVDKATTLDHYEKVNIEGCEYIIFYQKYEGRAIGIVHSGTCKNHNKGEEKK